MKVEHINIPVSEFQKHCLRLMEEVNNKKTEFIITKPGKPLAKLIPIAEKSTLKITIWSL